MEPVRAAQDPQDKIVGQPRRLPQRWQAGRPPYNLRVVLD